MEILGLGRADFSMRWKGRVTMGVLVPEAGHEAGAPPPTALRVAATKAEILLRDMFQEALLEVARDRLMANRELS
jgi:hypothetical protein